MNSLVTKLLLLLVLYASICLTSSVANEYTISNLDLDNFTSEKEVFHLFQKWKKETKREYETIEEEAAKFQIFKSNLKYIQDKNARRKSPNDYRLGLNKFSDMTYEEFSKIFLYTEDPILKGNDSKMVIINNESCPNAPPTWDWRDENAVTHVREQGTCGACWAFSTIGAIEGINQIVSQRLTSLSDQQLISCDQEDHGCAGGRFMSAFQYVINNGGLASEDDYPFTSDNSACNSTLAQNIAATIDSFENWIHNPVSESSLQCYVYQQPVSVAIYASKNLHSYNSGIFDGDDCSAIGPCELNHAVLIIGYGTSNDGQDYWIAKNSWGPTWGQYGYVLIKRNTGSAPGVCNINCSGAYPIKGNKQLHQF